MPLPRNVQPEILDHLPPDAPEAMRSRRDLRWIDALMGNARWARRAVGSLARAGERIVELGAGDGRLCGALGARGFAVTGCDRIARPAGLPDSVAWREGDIRDSLPGLEGEVAAAVLFLHHFDDAALGVIGAHLRRAFRAMVICEPHRHRMTLILGRLLVPVVGAVTRHDMRASIHAGFRPGELPGLLGLRSDAWHWSEHTTVRGAIRILARRKAP